MHGPGKDFADCAIHGQRLLPQRLHAAQSQSQGFLVADIQKLPGRPAALKRFVFRTVCHIIHFANLCVRLNYYISKRHLTRCVVNHFSCKVKPNGIGIEIEIEIGIEIGRFICLSPRPHTGSVKPKTLSAITLCKRDPDPDSGGMAGN